MVLKAALFGFDGKYKEAIPIVPMFDFANYQPAGWQPKNAGSTIYRLYGLVCHHGETIDAGHYTALCLRDGQWWHIDDNPPSGQRIELPTNLPSAQLRANPYIFFYVRDGTGPYEINADDSFVMRPLPVPAALAAPAGSGLSAEELAAYPRFAMAAARLAALKAQPTPRTKRNRVTRKKQRAKH